MLSNFPLVYFRNSLIVSPSYAPISAKDSLLDNEIISSEEDVSFELMKKDDGAVDDFISSSGKVEMTARCKDQNITFILDTSELLKCLKFLEN